MLWVNGYSNKWASLLGIAPEAGRGYWANSLGAAMKVLNDWSWIFINPGSSLLSSALERFREGYKYAARNQKKLKEHILLSGNHLTIIAHGHGLAFAEGIAAYLYEERGIKTGLLIALQGSQLNFVPQSRNAVETRIVLNTNRGFTFRRLIGKLRFADIAITESTLSTGFIKYDFKLCRPDFTQVTEYLYLKGKIHWSQRKQAQRFRQPLIWTAISKALQVIDENREESQVTSKDNAHELFLDRYVKNQN